MKIVYVGPFVDGVEIEDGQWAERGKPLDVDSALAERLLEQPDNFARPTTKAAKAAEEDASSTE